MEFPSEPVLREVVRRIARLHAERGAEIGRRPLVLPTEEFFPDVYTADAGSAAALVRRMQTHAGLADVPITTEVVSPEGVATRASSCSSGACAMPVAFGESFTRLAADPATDGWLLRVAEPELSNPVCLTTVVARTLGTIFLAETGSEDEVPDPDAEITADLAAVSLGLGVLLLQGSYVYSKSCGGPSVAKLTRLGVGEVAVALALFVEAGGHKVRRIKAHLGATQESVFSEATAWAATNSTLVELLRDAPERAMEHEIELEARPWLLRVLGGKKKTPSRAEPNLDAEATLDELEASLGAVAVKKPAARRDPKRDELRALVDDALREAGTGGE